MKSGKTILFTGLRQLWHFVIHLRWHYQLFILSGGFLLGGFLSQDLNTRIYVIQFLNVHLLLFGGATAYNSYWDKDEGPVGGLRNPPKMSDWMWGASLLLQCIGLLLAVPLGMFYVGIYALSMLLFWLYSTPLARWKSRPIKSLIAIGLSTGLNAVLLGYLAAGNPGLSFLVLAAAVGVSLMLLSLYPISQIYQLEEDRRRGDHTFTVQYGISGLRLFFDAAFWSGLFIISLSIAALHMVIGIVFGSIGAITGGMVRSQVYGLTATKEDYRQVMRIKYGTSMAFVAFLLGMLVLKHLKADELSGLVDLLF